MDTLQLPTNLDIAGDLIIRGRKPAYARADLAQQDFATIGLPLLGWRVWDAFPTALGAAAADDLGIRTGTWGTGNPLLTAGDLKSAGATTRYARCLLCLPLEYVAGQTVRLRFAAGMLTTIADGACTLDLEVFKLARTGLISGVDLNPTAAQNINSLVFADLDFDLSPTTLAPGDWLDIRIAIACTDTATGTVVEPAIALAELLADIKG